jgi:hypothetical protein
MRHYYWRITQLLISLSSAIVNGCLINCEDRNIGKQFRERNWSCVINVWLCIERFWDLTSLFRVLRYWLIEHIFVSRNDSKYLFVSNSGSFNNIIYCYFDISYCNWLFWRDKILSYSAFSNIQINHFFLYTIFNFDFRFKVRLTRILWHIFCHNQIICCLAIWSPTLHHVEVDLFECLLYWFIFYKEDMILVSSCPCVCTRENREPTEKSSTNFVLTPHSNLLNFVLHKIIPSVVSTQRILWDEKDAGATPIKRILTFCVCVYSKKYATFFSKVL